MNKLRSFLTNVDTLSTVMSGKHAAAAFIIGAKLGFSVHPKGRYKGLPLSFRKDDITAIREVLEKEEYAPLAYILKGQSSPIVLDIGSHIGTTARWMLSQNPQARILSVEANSANFEVLKKNHENSRTAYPSWQILHGAAWKDNDGVSFIDDGPTMSRRVGGMSSIKVPSYTLPNIIAKASPSGRAIDLAKIDIEGAEEAFICAQPDALDQIKTLVIELHPNLCDTDKVLELLNNKYKKMAPVHDRKSSKPLLIFSNPE